MKEMNEGKYQVTRFARDNNTLKNTLDLVVAFVNGLL